MMDRSVPVLILQMSVGRLHHGSLGIVRSLGRLGVPVYVFRTGRWAPIPRSRYVAGAFAWRLAGLDPPTVLDDLLAVGRAIGRRAVLIPTDDVGAIFTNDHAAALGEHFIFPQQPAGLARRLASKQQMYWLCKDLGVPTPETVFPSGRADVLQFLESAQLPVAVKAIDAGRIPLERGGKSVLIAHTAAELLDYYDRVELPDAPNLMLQEYIPGGAESVWMFNGYFDADSTCLVGWTGQKIRQFPPYTGATTLGIVRWNAAVADATCDLMRRLGYRGILDCGWRYDQRDGQYKLLDVNPRIGATFRLFVDRAGLDVARALYADLTGQPVRGDGAQDGRRWLVENQDVAAARIYYQDGHLGLGEYVRSLGGVRETAWFAADDPLPAAIALGAALVRGALGSAQKVRG